VSVTTHAFLATFPFPEGRGTVSAADSATVETLPDPRKAGGHPSLKGRGRQDGSLPSLVVAGALPEWVTERCR
jgi:hypothetical protein